MCIFRPRETTQGKQHMLKLQRFLAVLRLTHLHFLFLNSDLKLIDLKSLMVSVSTSRMSNSNTTDAHPVDLTPVLMSRILMCVGIATLLLNTFVIIIFAAVKWMRSNANIIICSMAITDLLAGFVTIVAGAGKWTDWFRIQGIFCDMFFTFDIWAAMASLAHVLVVNLQRYLDIVYPLASKSMATAFRVKLLLVLIWVVTFGEAVGYRLSQSLDDQCLWNSATLPGLALGILVSSVAVPFLSVFVIYSHIVIVVVKKLRFMAKSSNLDQAALARSQRKMFVTVSAILAAWIICWLPLMSVIIALTGAQAFNLYLDIGQFVTMLHFVEVMSYGNSLLNPILYFLTSADFRNAALELFRQKPSSKHTVSVTSQSSKI